MESEYQGSDGGLPGGGYSNKMRTGTHYASFSPVLVRDYFSAKSAGDYLH